MAEPKIVKNIHIQQWNGDENYWSTQEPLREGEIGIVTKTNTKNATKIVVGNGISNTSQLLLGDSVFYAGIGAGYILPPASNTLLGGVKISDTYFYTDGEALKLKILKSILDDNPDNPDEFNKINKNGNQAFISTPATDWKLRGDFYAEALYADEAHIKNIVYDQETNIDYLSKYLDIHKDISEEFTIQLTPNHYYWERGEYRPEEIEAGYKYDVNIKEYLYIPEQTIDVYTNTPETTPTGYAGFSYDYSVIKDEAYNTLYPEENSTWVTFVLPSPDYIGAIDHIFIRGGYTSSGGLGANITTIDDPTKIQFTRSSFENDRYYTNVHFLYPESDWTVFEYLDLTYYKCTKKTYTIPEALLSSGSKLSIPLESEWYSLDISWADTVLSIDAPEDIDIYNGYASHNILTLYDGQTVIDVLQDDERAGIKIYNYHKNDQEISKDKRKIAELSINNSGTLKYTPDNSSPNNFYNILMVNKAQDILKGFLFLEAEPDKEDVAYSFHEKIPTQYVDLSGIKDLKITCNISDAGTYFPLSSDPQYININACTSIVANGIEHTVDTYGKITLSDSTWTNELQDLLSTAVQKITFDDEEFSGPTITLKSKIQKITLDGLDTTIKEDGCVDLKSKIQSITYDGVKHEESDIVIYATRLSSLETTKGSEADERKYNTINITEDLSTRTYLISHYDTDTINEPVGTDTNIIGEPESKTSFNLMSNLSYDHYGHAEQYSSYTLDFSRLVARIEELETKVAELEKQLKAS